MSRPDPTGAPSLPTESRILELYVHSPVRGLEALHLRYHTRCCAFVRRNLSGLPAARREELLPDIVQDTLLSLHERLKRQGGLPSGYTLDALVFLTCRRTVLDTLRRLSRRHARELSTEPDQLEQTAGTHPAPVPEAQVLRQETRGQLDDCLERLTVRARIVVVRTSQGFSNAEIQAEADIPHASTVCKTRAKAYAQLKQCLEAFETEVPQPLSRPPHPPA